MGLHAHQNTTYPLLVNDTLFKNKEINFSIIIDADINKTGFKFIIQSNKSISLSSLTISANAKYLDSNNQTEFQGIAKFNQQDSTDRRHIYDLTLPLPKTGNYSVYFAVENDAKLIKQYNFPIEIVPEGPTKNEMYIYLIPFILVFLFILKIYFQKKKNKKLIN